MRSTGARTTTLRFSVCSINPSFPFGTLAVDVVGCFAMGLLGGFTTFSAFAYETTSLLRDFRLLGAWLNVGLEVFFGLMTGWFGGLLSRLIPHSAVEIDAASEVRSLKTMDLCF